MTYCLCYCCCVFVLFFLKKIPLLCSGPINKKINLSIEYFDRLFLVSALDSFKIQIILYNCSFWFRRRWSNLIPWPYAIKLKLRCYHSCWREIFLHAPPKMLANRKPDLSPTIICLHHFFARVNLNESFKVSNQKINVADV